jgi:hypothetical protein
MLSTVIAKSNLNSFSNHNRKLNVSAAPIEGGKPTGTPVAFKKATPSYDQIEAKLSRKKLFKQSDQTNFSDDSNSLFYEKPGN